MAIPASVEPFVEPEFEQGHKPGSIERVFARPVVLIALCLGVVSALLADASRTGVFASIPAPLDAAQSAAGYAIALALGAGAAWLLARRRVAVEPQPTLSARLPVFLRFDDRRAVGRRRRRRGRQGAGAAGGGRARHGYRA